MVIKPSRHIPAESSVVEVQKLLAYNMELGISRMKDSVEEFTFVVDMVNQPPTSGA